VKVRNFEQRLLFSKEISSEHFVTVFSISSTLDSILIVYSDSLRKWATAEQRQSIGRLPVLGASWGLKSATVEAWAKTMNNSDLQVSPFSLLNCFSELQWVLSTAQNLLFRWTEWLLGPSQHSGSFTERTSDVQFNLPLSNVSASELYIPTKTATVFQLPKTKKRNLTVFSERPVHVILDRWADGLEVWVIIHQPNLPTRWKK